MSPRPPPPIGHNSRHTAEGQMAEAYATTFAHLVRRIAAAYNHAAAHKRDANERIRDITRDEVAKSPDYFEGLDDARKGAIDKKRERLRKRPDYVEAEADKANAAGRQRDAVKEAKAAGVDMAALKDALKLGKLDTEERKDYFDRVDIYAKELGYWTAGDD